LAAPRSPPTRLIAIPDKWVRPTRSPTDLSIGLPDLTCGPKVRRQLDVQAKTVQTN
jgi:hypothetical protein